MPHKSDFRVSLVEGFDFWEIGRWEWEWRALWEAEQFVARIPHKEIGDWAVEVHEMTESGRRLIHRITKQGVEQSQPKAA
jgi:hypothetical protein